MPCAVCPPTEPVTCGFDAIIGEQPFALVKPEPTYVVGKAMQGGQPLSGNYCPLGAKDPFTYCQAGEEEGGGRVGLGAQTGVRGRV